MKAYSKSWPALNSQCYWNKNYTREGKLGEGEEKGSSRSCIVAFLSNAQFSFIYNSIYRVFLHWIQMKFWHKMLKT